ncbi:MULTISPECIES: HDOD domain-containing protein [Idiomarina]|jgi:HD-like signal output (HDOD) protein|uniref:HDOD domain-containing protein n=1 Tax=Idiomarina TaxID=135575 RepID=UPI000C6AE117|nr:MULTISPECIES: HDOD domain-containing protein [Idiomarina]MAO68335.1 histidine kinase [Idiomarina sp.]MBE92724.1 histidine kinase [Idiomarina sp.]MBF81517.1 histidine kinase [Idiomarina sp.]MBH94053.1 histidine kinase [Idiomarina sp.]MBP58992.1 histidine kinase [Idiomarina sp.]|tara:strand:- start:276 stop:1124 length:849 start_codon:yes stop_codon:yes gene_type:complete
MSSQNALYLLIDERLKRDELKLPGLPETAEQVRNATMDPDCNLHDLSHIIQQDTVLSARLIRLANSAYLGGRNKAESLMQALTRIGMRRIRTLALAMAMEQVFKPDNDIVKMFSEQFINESREIAAASVVITQDLQRRGIGHRLHQDVSLLAGMISRIGVAPILRMANEFEDSFANPSFINECITQFSSALGSNILRYWQFTPNLVQVPLHFYKGRMELDDAITVNYCDIVHLASLLTGNAKPNKNSVTVVEYQMRGVIKTDDFWQQESVQESYRQMLELLS